MSTSLPTYLPYLPVTHSCVLTRRRGEWCNIEPAGFGPAPTTKTNNTYVDAIVWVKPGGESDGECGMEGAPRAGEWFDEYAQMLVKNAHPSVFKRWFW